MSALKQFQALVKKVGVQTPNRFGVELKIPPNVLSLFRERFNVDIQERINLWATDSNIPGFSATTSENHVGHTRHHAVTKSENDYTITFLCAGDMMEHNLFQTWKDVIFPKDHSVAFYDNYISDKISMFTKNRTDQKSKEVSLYEAWPTIVTDIQTNMASRDEFSTFQVTFKFRKQYQVIPSASGSNDVNKD